jgi:N-methylhydantoinase A
MLPGTQFAGLSLEIRKDRMNRDDIIVIGVDIGGTFTDFVAIDRTTALIAPHKELTTPDQPEKAVLSGLQVLLSKLGVELADVNAIVHGTTLATNLLVERKGDRVGLITTRGFGDVIEIARERRFDPYRLAIEPPRPLVPPEFRREISERTRPDGTVETEPSDPEVRRAVVELRAADCRSLAVALLFSPANPGNERAIRDICDSVDPEIYVSLSSDIDNELAEYERTSTTVINAYIQPTLAEYLQMLEKTLASGGYPNQLFVMLSSGGVARSEMAREYPVRFIESGPVGGVMATASLARRLGLGRAVAFDMGGTTAKIAVVNDYEPETGKSFEVARVEWHRPGSGLPVRSPILELIEIGLGGGSIGRVDALGALAIGPDSAGASPGPACYERGGTNATTTDSDLILGYIDPVSIAGGMVTISKEAAQTAVGVLASALGSSVADCAWAMHRVANEEMAISARLHLMERGYRASDYALVASGGAGPVHAYRLAEILDMSTIVYPIGAGVMSALGFVTSPVSISVFRPRIEQLADIEDEVIRNEHASMEDEARSECVRAGIPAADISLEWYCRVSCQGQRDELEVRIDPADGSADETLGDQITSEFARRYKALFGIQHPAVPLQVAGWRIVAKGPEAAFRFAREADTWQRPAGTRTRTAFFPEAGGWIVTPVVRRDELPPGAQVAGPLIVEEAESTLVIGPTWAGVVDETTLAIVVTKEGAGPVR